jgi:hypothetical protein
MAKRIRILLHCRNPVSRDDWHVGRFSLLALELNADLRARIIELSSTNELARFVSRRLGNREAVRHSSIATTAPSEDGARVTPEIAAALGVLPQHARTTTDAFSHAPTRDAIEKTGRRTIAIAGVATEIIVQHSAFSAAAAGFQVRIVADASSGLSARTDDAALRGLTQAGVITTSIASIAGQLAGDFTQPRDAKAVGVLASG